MKNRLRILLFLFLASFASSVVAQRHSTDISDFFDELNRNKKLDIKRIDKRILKWEYNDIYTFQDETIPGFVIPGLMTSDSLKQYLKPNDLKAFEMQYKSFDDTIWNSSDLKNFKLIDSLGVDKILKASMKKNKLKNNYCYKFSLPLFSEDKKTVILKQEFYCGFMCSSQCIYIYRKSDDNKTWKEVGSWNCWST